MSSSTNTSVNGTTIAPEVAAFVSNSKQLIIAGSVTGGIIVLLITGIIVCCRCIRRQTSDEAKENKRIKRKTKFERRKYAAAEEAEKQRAKQARNAGKVRRGRIAAYDEALARSFANLTGIGRKKLTKDEDDMSDDDDFRSGSETDTRVGALSPGAAGNSALSRTDSVRSPSEAGDGDSSSPTSRPRALSRARTVSLMSGGSAGDGGIQDTVTIKIEDMPGLDSPREAMPAVQLSRLSSPVIAPRSGIFVLGAVRKLPMPRTQKEAEVMYGHRNSMFDAVIESHLAEEQKRLAAAATAAEQLSATRRKAAEMRALDALHVHAALRPGAAPTVNMLQESDSVDTSKRQRFSSVAVDDYYSVAL